MTEPTDDFVWCEAAHEWDHEWRPVDDGDEDTLECSECGVTTAS